MTAELASGCFCSCVAAGRVAKRTDRLEPHNGLHWIVSGHRHNI